MEHISKIKKSYCSPCYNCYRKGCRCDGCRASHAERNKLAARKRRRPDENWANKRVDPKRAREHLLFLKSKGFLPSMVAAHLGLRYHSMVDIVNGKRTYIHQSREKLILSVTEFDCPTRYPAAPVTNKIIYLTTHGVVLDDLVRLTGLKRGTVQALKLGERVDCDREAAMKILKALPEDFSLNPHAAAMARKFHADKLAS